MADLKDLYQNLLKERRSRPQMDCKIQGTCTDFCPYFERIERTLRGDISVFETTEMFKKYYRSSAGRDKALPEDIRPIGVLKEATKHLLKLSYGNYSLEMYRFIENRTRSIRLDLAVQDLECDNAIWIYEHVARLLIVFGYMLCEDDGFEEHLNLDQVKKVVATLVDIYDKKSVASLCKRKGLATHKFAGDQNDKGSKEDTNSQKFKVINNFCSVSKSDKLNVNSTEGEFRAYYILLHLNERYPPLNTNSIEEMYAMKMLKLYQQCNFYAFFCNLRRASFLPFCVLWSNITKTQLHSLAIYKRAFVEKLSADHVKNLIWSTSEELLAMCNRLGIKHSHNEVDFKSPESEVDERIKKEKKLFVNMEYPSKFVFLGNIDLYVFRYAVMRYVVKHYENYRFELRHIADEYLLAELGTNIGDAAVSANITSGNSKKYSTIATENKIDTSSDNEDAGRYRDRLTSKLATCLLKLYLMKIFSQKINHQLKLKTKEVEEKQRAKNLCMKLLQIKLTDYSVEYLSSNIQHSTYSRYLGIWKSKCIKATDMLAIVLDKKVFSALFRSRVVKSKLMEFQPKMFYINNTELDVLLAFNMVIFSVSSKMHKEVKKKNCMLNMIIDTPQNLCERIDEIYGRVIVAKKVCKSLLSELIANKNVSEASYIVTKLISNKRNRRELEENLIRIYNNKSIVDFDVYYEKNEV